MAETTTKKPAKKTTAKVVTAEAKPTANKPAVEKKPAVAKKAPISAKPVEAAKSTATKAKAPTVAKKTTSKAMLISDEQRYRMVAEAAYYRAESNQFKSDPLRDWIEAENDIAARLSGGK